MKGRKIHHVPDSISITFMGFLKSRRLLCFSIVTDLTENYITGKKKVDAYSSFKREVMSVCGNFAGYSCFFGGWKL